MFSDVEKLFVVMISSYEEIIYIGCNESYGVTIGVGTFPDNDYVIVIVTFIIMSLNFMYIVEIMSIIMMSLLLLLF